MSSSVLIIMACITKSRLFKILGFVLIITMSFEEEVKKSSQVTFISQASRRNARYQRNMEDRHTVIPCLDNDENIFYASVFDGHGGNVFFFFFKNR